MTYGSFYKKASPGKRVSLYNNMTYGVNEYTPANRIKDDFMSKCLDVKRYREESIYLSQYDSPVLLNALFTGAGRVYTGLADTYPSDSTAITFVKYLFLVVGDDAVGSNAYLDDLVIMNITSPAISTIDISSYSLYKSAYHSMCTFFTEAYRYVCYANSGSKKLFYYNYKALDYVDLPFYPRKIVNYANRIFASDINNKIWWCRAGDLSSWYSMETDDDYFYTGNMKDSGTYTIISGHTTPPSPRVLSFKVTPLATSGDVDTLGTITIVGKDWQALSISETVTLENGTCYSNKAYAEITSLTQAGHTTVGTLDTIKIGYAASGNGYVQEDAGYWTLEEERQIVDIAVINNALFLFTEVNIHIFRGYSYDTFTKDLLFKDIGTNYPVTVANNVIFFLYNGDVLLFNGEEYPRIIGRPIERNGQSVNGMFGGISISTAYYNGLAADCNDLFLYRQYYATTSSGVVMQMYIYKYNFKSATWSFHSGFCNTSTGTSGDYVRAIYIPDSDRSGFYNVCTTRNDTSEAVWYVYTTSGWNANEDPYFITKCFNYSPSTDGTLTEIILEVKGNPDAIQMDIEVSYSLTVDEDDFEVLWTMENYDLTGDVQIISIPVPKDMIARAHHYRLKVSVTPSSSSHSLHLYNIERRFRLIGRSR